MMGKCTSSELASNTVCPFGDDLVLNGTQGIILSSKFVPCSEFISILTNMGKSDAAFCSSESGRSNCCSSCLSKF